MKMKEVVEVGFPAFDDHKLAFRRCADLTKDGLHLFWPILGQIKLFWIKKYQTFPFVNFTLTADIFFVTFSLSYNGVIFYPVNKVIEMPAGWTGKSRRRPVG
ncbi:hypothetical protein GCM10023143_24490 [Compostibacter hankyongensis]|uniref:Uncharacterized protein n=1 Tax=Compostibacter hankyongensis TaxID=1007089 RepID=A0ABP8FZ38_9BACT